MNWKTTVTMLVAVVLLGLWVWLGDSSVGSSDDRGREGRRLFPHLQVEQVLELEVRRPDPEGTVRVSRADGPVDPMLGPSGWTLEQPLADDADDAIVNRIINTIEFAEWVESIPAERADSVEFGETQLTVTIGRSEGREGYELVLGEARPSGVTPARVGHRDDVYLIRSTLIDAFPKGIWSYRRKILFNAPLPEVVGFEVQRVPLTETPGVERETIAVSLADGFWRLAAGEGDFASPALVKGMLEQFMELSAISSENDAPTPEDLASYGLAPTPWATLSVDLPEDMPDAPASLARHQVIKLGNPVPDQKGARYALYGERPFVYRVMAGGLVNELTQRTTAEFHNPSLFPVRGSSETVTGFGALFNGGDEWRLQKRGPSWIFEGDGDVKASPNPALELARVLVELQVDRLVGHRDDLELSKLGLEAPEIKLELVEDSLRREAHVGSKVSGQPGHFYVMRLDDGRVFEADLGLLPQRMKAAPLELLDRRIFRASSFDSKRIVITSAEGQPILDVTRIPAEEGGELEHWRVDAPPALQADADSDRIQRFADLFDQVNVDRYVAHDGDEARARFGLEQPVRVAITVTVYGEDQALSDEVRELLLGRREGSYVYALNPKQGVVGRIDATFLDLLERGFAQGTPILQLDRWSVTELVAYEKGAEVMRLTKHGDNWKRDNLELAERLPIEKLLSAFERIEVTRPALATDEAKAAKGLGDPPRLRVTFEVTPMAGGEPELHELWVGDNLESRYELWATSVKSGQGHDRLGALFHDPLLMLKRYRQDFPPPSAFPPVEDPDKQGQ